MKQPSTLKDKIESSARRGFMKSTSALFQLAIHGKPSENGTCGQRCQCVGQS
jgi:hypothetical protein